MSKKIPKSDLKQKSKLLNLTLVTGFISLVPTFYVAYISNSITLYADFLRCSGEFIAIFMSWMVFRRVSRPSEKDFNYGFGKLEQFASLTVGLAMLLTFVVLLFAAIHRFIEPASISNIFWGILFTLLSIVGNAYVWIKSTVLHQRQPSPLAKSQAGLFRAKTFVSVVVLVSLSLSYFFSNTNIALYIDPLGSLVISGFMLYSAIAVLSSSVSDLLDKSLDEVLQIGVLRSLVTHEDLYKGFAGMRSRRSGGQIYIELFLEFNQNQTIKEVLVSKSLIRESLLKVIPGAEVSIVIS
ncbi:MAG: cation diffusion facilitator family transporter [bacterium]|nr:cation diffusion facilitator family transporter [bacterium]